MDIYALDIKKARWLLPLQSDVTLLVNACCQQSYWWPGEKDRKGMSTTLSGNNTEKEGNITDGRIQIQTYLEPLDSHQQAFSINSYTQVQKFNCVDSLEETSLMGCIHWMRISFSWQVLDSLCSLQSCCAWRNLLCSGNGTKKDPTKVEDAQMRVPETLSHLEIVANKTNLPRQGKGRQSGCKMAVSVFEVLMFGAGSWASLA